MLKFQRSKQAPPVIIELLEGAQPVSIKQYTLRHKTWVRIEPIITTFINQRLLRECRPSCNTPILPVQKPNESS